MTLYLFGLMTKEVEKRDMTTTMTSNIQDLEMTTRRLKTLSIPK